MRREGWYRILVQVLTLRSSDIYILPICRTVLVLTLETKLCILIFHIRIYFLRTVIIIGIVLAVHGFPLWLCIVLINSCLYLQTCNLKGFCHIPNSNVGNTFIQKVFRICYYSIFLHSLLAFLYLKTPRKNPPVSNLL